MSFLHLVNCRCDINRPVICSPAEGKVQSPFGLMPYIWWVVCPTSAVPARCGIFGGRDSQVQKWYMQYLPLTIMFPICKGTEDQGNLGNYEQRTCVKDFSFTHHLSLGCSCWQSHRLTSFSITQGLWPPGRLFWPLGSSFGNQSSCFSRRSRDLGSGF